MKTIKQDITTITEGIICHQVNVLGVSGGVEPFFMHGYQREIQSMFEGVIEDAYAAHEQIYVPYKMGCGLAGGSWATVSQMIEKLEEQYDVEIIICKFK